MLTMFVLQTRGWLLGVLSICGCAEDIFSAHEGEDLGQDTSNQDAAEEGGGSAPPDAAMQPWSGACSVRVETLGWGEADERVWVAREVLYERASDGHLLAEIHDHGADGTIDGVFSYDYDGAGWIARITSTIGNEPAIIDVTYDETGGVSTTWFRYANGIGSSTHVWSYDEAGRPLQERRPEDSPEHGVFYRYDVAGRLIEQETLVLHPDAPGGIFRQLTWFDYQSDGGYQVFTRYAHQPDSLVSEWTCRDGLVHEFTINGELYLDPDLPLRGKFHYDERNRLIAVDGGQFEYWRYAYDELGYLWTATRFEYDDQGDGRRVVEERVYDYACRPANAQPAERSNVDRRFFPRMRGWLGTSYASSGFTWGVVPLYTLEELYAPCEPY